MGSSIVGLVADKRRRHTIDPAMGDPAFNIFISYRRSDSEGYAGRLYDQLTRPFGAENIFMDVDTVAPGQDFQEALLTAITRCEVLLAVISPGWLAAKNVRGKRRIDDEEDWVRIEIADALSIGKWVIPLLFGGAAMPREQDLPAPLKPLARRQAMPLRHDRFQADAADLIKALQRLEQDRAAPLSTQPQGRSPYTAPAGLARVAQFRSAEVQRPMSPGRTTFLEGPTSVQVNEDLLTYREFMGTSVEEALEAATEHFGVGLSGLDFEVVTTGSRGVLGMGQEPARIVAKLRAR